MEITPKDINQTIKEFCHSINRNITPCYVIVEPYERSVENYCFENVEAVISEQGGESVMGWAIWQRDNMYLEAEAHAIWRTQGGDLIDVTPHTPKEEYILFVQDERVERKIERIPSVFCQLTRSNDVRRYIELVKEIREIENLNRDENGIVGLSGSLKDQYIRLKQQIEEFDMRFNSSVGRNDLCPCGSGMKYKRCCGWYR